MYKINPKFFNKINSPEKAYFLGLLYADGNNYKKDGIHQVSLELLKEDEKVIKLLASSLETNKPIKYRKAKVDKNGFKIKERCGLVISNKYLSDKLNSIGLIPRKTLKLKFPEFIKKNKILVKNFIRGYFDGDGCVSIGSRNNIKTSISGVNEFIISINEILQQENIKSKIYKHKKINNFLEIYINKKEENLKFYNFLYEGAKDFFIDRKKEKYEIFFNNK